MKIHSGCSGLAHSGMIRGGRLGAGHGRPARMSESHAGTSWYLNFGCGR